MKAFRIPSLVLAAILQMLPLARVAAICQQPVAPLWAIFLRWAGAAAAALGSIEAVSGASTQITNPLTATGTNGIPFKQFRLTTAPDQAHYWTASGLPAGLKLTGTSGQTFWAITGTPTVAGSFTVRLTAKDQATSGFERTVTANLALTIIANGTAPSIATQPISQTVNVGSPVTFSVSADGTPPLAYQWKKDGNDISSATSSSLTLPTTTSADAGTYTVLVSNSISSILSQGATLTVNNPISPPVISSAPQSQTAYIGQNVTFSASVTGSDPLAYQWFHGTTQIAGATSTTLTLNSIDSSAAGDYILEVSNPAATGRSAPATLTVTTLQILSAVQNGDSTVLTWSGIPGQKYRIMAVDALGQTWQPLTVAPQVDANGLATVTLPDASPGQFFRVSTYP